MRLSSAFATYALGSFLLVAPFACGGGGGGSSSLAPAEKYTVTLGSVTGGTLTLSPAGGEYVAGTFVTVTAKADDGKAFVSWSGDLQGRDAVSGFVVSGNRTISATFKDMNAYAMTAVPAWVQTTTEAGATGMNLGMDIYTPQTGKASYPVVIIFHGGGWGLYPNHREIMNAMAQYLVQNGEFVVCNVDYRLLQEDGGIGLNRIIEDCFGALVWVREHISAYKGDPARIGVTGDSAGGHLAAIVANAGDHVGSSGFTASTYQFKPTYLPAGISAESVDVSVQACAPSYGVGRIDASILNGMLKLPTNTTAHYQACSPIDNLPAVNTRKLAPQFWSGGSLDYTVTPASIQTYVNAALAAGQDVSSWTYDGQPHAYLDGTRASASNYTSGIAPEALDRMLEFFNRVLVP